jgi:type I restriction enzyme S subunit
MSMAVIRPPIEEQRAIVEFLDRETARIDALVAKKERLIELLLEKRTALITRAVTKGLDPNVPMKDSGVEWLGEIPAHWEPTPLKRILRRSDYGISESLASGGNVRVLTMGHIQDGGVVLPEEGSINDVDDALVLEDGDLLFNRTNSRELVGKVGIFRGSREDRVTFASYLVRMTAKDGVVAEWLNYLLNSAGVLGLARSLALLSVNQANLNATKYTQIVVPIVPLLEQRALAAFLDQETARIDALVAKVRDAIDRLKELRTALISAAVTGKIDVREEAK